MALSMEIHRQVEGLTGEAFAATHAPDLDVEEKCGVKSLRYCYAEGSGTLFCLCEAQRLLAQEILEAKEAQRGESGACSEVRARAWYGLRRERP